MASPRFYVQSLQPGLVSLSEAESRHLRGARRLSEGDVVILFNGRGDVGHGRVCRSGGRSPRAEIAVERIEHQPRPDPQLTLATALPKGPRQDWLIEKCTELAVLAIQPIVTQRSIAEASAHRVARWRQITIEAAKQSGQAWLPDLNEAIPLAALLERSKDYDGAFIACGSGTTAAAGVLWPSRTLVLIGPEGDWTPEELDAARDAGVMALSLGPGILRIETAAVSIAALVHARMRFNRAEPEDNPVQ